MRSRSSRRSRISRTMRRRPPTRRRPLRMRLPPRKRAGHGRHGQWCGEDSAGYRQCGYRRREERHHHRRSGQGCRQCGKRRRRKREEDRRQCGDTGQHGQCFGQCGQVRRGFRQVGRFHREVRCGQRQGHRFECFERGDAGEGHRRQRGPVRHRRGQRGAEGEYGCCRRRWRGERQGRRAHTGHSSGHVNAQADYLVDRHHRWCEHAETVERQHMVGGDRQGRYRCGQRRRQGTCCRADCAINGRQGSDHSRERRRAGESGAGRREKGADHCGRQESDLPWPGRTRA